LSAQTSKQTIIVNSRQTIF